MTVNREDLLKGLHRAYFIGIGGVGMSSLARVLKYQGFEVSGSDLKTNKTTRALSDEGIPVYIGQQENHFAGSDLVIYSTAISRTHPELTAAREAGMRVYHRAEILSSLVNHAETSVAITGTHGKTTTSSMISFVLARCEKNPTCLIGGDIINFDSNAVLGGSSYLIAEVDESDRSHERYAPNYAVVTNLEEEHVDFYPTLNDLESSFSRFLENLSNPGLVVYCREDERLCRIMSQCSKPKIAYGFDPAADFCAENVSLNGFGSEFDLVEAGLYATRVRLSVPGRHNVLNATAALAVLSQLGIDMEMACEAIFHFRGARRRLEVKWQSDELIIVDDYAHHPTEVRASLDALLKIGRKVTVVFQPHRFTRTARFYKQFAEALQKADELILTEIYGAGEDNPTNVSSEMICQCVGEMNPAIKVMLMPKQKILDQLARRTWSGNIVAFFGAGDISEIAGELAARYKNLATA